MSRFFLTLCTAGALAGFSSASRAADSPLTQEVHELRRDIQMQAKRIEALTEHVARLTQALEERNRAVSAPAPIATAAEMRKPDAPSTAPAPATTVPAGEIPKAELVASSTQHTVEKGETLTSIAKHYNIPLSELQRLNKITNDRKLQIGQTLVVPAPPKAPETPVEKKETP